jgi:antitoxin (DNA-binding transcriptional repressor) of toxin-antitoxin stability system
MRLLLEVELTTAYQTVYLFVPHRKHRGEEAAILTKASPPVRANRTGRKKRERAQKERACESGHGTQLQLAERAKYHRKSSQNRTDAPDQPTSTLRRVRSGETTEIDKPKIGRHFDFENYLFNLNQMISIMARLNPG